MSRQLRTLKENMTLTENKIKLGLSVGNDSLDEIGKLKM